MVEEIETRREFRGQYLLTNPLGKGLLKLYYKVSPPTAKFITEHRSLKPIVRVGLLPTMAMSGLVANATLAEKTAIAGWLVLGSVVIFQLSHLQLAV